MSGGEGEGCEGERGEGEGGFESRQVVEEGGIVDTSAESSPHNA